MDSGWENKSITFLIGNMQRDGAERVISILAENYCKKGWKVDVLTLLDNSWDYELNPKIKHVPICRESKSSYRNIMFWLRGIRKYVNRKNPDVIVSFVARINILTLIACVGLKKSIVISERNDPAADGRNVFVKLAAFILYRLSDSIVFQTKWAQSCFPDSIIKKSFIIPNPVKVPCTAASVKRKKITAVGRLEPQKNHLLLIDAFAALKESYPEYELYIYGNGSLRKAVEQRLRDLGIEDSVYLPGNIPDLHEKIADSEIFVLPSNYEGLSNALLEAMMMGLSCISTSCAGSNEVIIDGVNGLLIPVGDRDRLICAIERLIINPEFAAYIGENAKKTSASFESNNVLKQWEEIIEK